MKRIIYKILGISLVLASLVGLAVAIIGITGIWKFEGKVLASLENMLAFLDTTLQTTADGLEVANTAIDQADDSLDTLVKTIETTGKSVQDLVPVLDVLTAITTIDLPDTITSTQKALESAQSSANIIDSTLQFIASIPFLGVKQAQPKAPLGDALGEVSDSLDGVPNSLRSMDVSLTDARTNLGSIESKFKAISEDINKIGDSLAIAKDVTTQYQDVVTTLQEKVSRTRQDLPVTLALIAIIFTVGFIWLGLTQIGLMMQGLEMMGVKFGKPVKLEVVSSSLPVPQQKEEVVEPRKNEPQNPEDQAEGKEEK